MKRIAPLVLLLFLFCPTVWGQINFHKEDIRFPVESKLTEGVALRVKQFSEGNSTTEKFKVSMVYGLQNLANLEENLQEKKQHFNSTEFTIAKDTLKAYKQHHEVVFILNELTSETFEAGFWEALKNLGRIIWEDDTAKLTAFETAFGKTAVEDAVKLTISKTFIALNKKYVASQSSAAKAGLLYIQRKVAVFDLTPNYSKIPKNRVNCKDKKLVRKSVFSQEPQEGSKPQKKTKSSLETSQTIPKVNVTIKSITLEIKEGTIHSIYVRAFIENGDPINFTNRYPIAFSTQKNFRQLNLAGLYNENRGQTGQVYRMRLADLLFYEPQLTLNSYDYSPRSDTYEFFFEDDKTKEVVFHKEVANEILNIKVFTDFIGFDESNPNGLVQSEFSKQIVLNPHNRSRANFFKFIEPRLTISKVENQKRDLEVDTTLNMLRNKTIDIFQYANLSIGADANVFSYISPRFKTTFELNVGSHLYRTSHNIPDKLGLGVDSSEVITNRGSTFNSVSFSFEYEALAKLRLHPNWSLDAGFRVFQLRTDSKQFRQTGVARNFTMFAKNGTLFSPRILASFQPDDSQTKFFFRGAYIKSFDTSYNYLQLQVGITKQLSLTKKKQTK